MTTAPSDIDALVEAIKASDVETVKALISQGVNPNAEDRYGKPPLIYAVSKNDVAMVNALLDQGADIDQPFSAGVTPLMAAAEKSAAVIPTLIVRGAQLDLKDISGNTALDWAKKFSRTSIRTEVTKLLLEAQEKQRELANPHGIARERQAALKNIRPKAVLKP